VTDTRQRAAEQLTSWRGDDYVFGLDCFDGLGEQVASLGQRAAVITSGLGTAWGEPIHAATRASLVRAGVELASEPIRGARPNSPREDVLRLRDELATRDPDVVVVVGGGSGIDAAKAALAEWTLGAGLDAYFGVGRVGAALRASGARMRPLVAAQLASGSAAHLTRYANVTDLGVGQKLLIVDDAIAPPKAVFDYRWTASMSPEFTMDGALDGVSHALEVWMGAPARVAERAREVCLGAIELIVGHLKPAVDDPGDLAAREGLGLGTDLGGYAIMLGGTNGAHLNSFSLVDLLPHGRACALMNPYYVVFFAPAIEDRLRAVGQVYARAGYTDADLDALGGRDLGLAVAHAMVELSRDIGFPATLAEVEGFTGGHVDRCLQAAKDPKLASKLKNMPVPLTPETVDEYMGAILDAARTGDFRRVRTMT
jgi:alcohol dehydrogenase class IV